MAHSLILWGRVCKDGVVAAIPANLYDLPLLPYGTVWDSQKFFVHRIQRSESLGVLLLVEHESVYTLGRTSKVAHYDRHLDLVRQKGIPILETGRGGSVTYHGPGQIIGYPILKIRNFCRGPKTYVRMLEEVIIRLLRDWGVEGRRIENYVGVWVNDQSLQEQPPAKIAAVGVRIERGVTLHGFSINVSLELDPFQFIIPCGIEGCRVTSMEEHLNKQVNLVTVRERLSHHFAEVFGLEWVGVFRELPKFSSAVNSDSSNGSSI